MRHLIVGGARSGKSGYAEAQLASQSGSVLYVATSRPDPGDDDFAQRVEEHRRRRPSEWETDESSDLIELVRSCPSRPLLIDDLGTWLTHELDRADAWDRPRGTIRPRCQQLVDAVADLPDCAYVVFVSPEVGMGLVPAHRSGRLFRDELGWLNAALAEVCDAVTLVVAGQPLELKPSAR